MPCHCESWKSRLRIEIFVLCGHIYNRLCQIQPLYFYIFYILFSENICSSDQFVESPSSSFLVHISAKFNLQHIPQPLRSHTQSVGTIGQILKILFFVRPNIVYQNFRALRAPNSSFCGGPAVPRTQGLASLAGILCIPKLTLLAATFMMQVHPPFPFSPLLKLYIY